MRRAAPAFCPRASLPLLSSCLPLLLTPLPATSLCSPQDYRCFPSCCPPSGRIPSRTLPHLLPGCKTLRLNLLPCGQGRQQSDGTRQRLGGLSRGCRQQQTAAGLLSLVGRRCPLLSSHPSSRAAILSRGYSYLVHCCLEDCTHPPGPRDGPPGFGESPALRPAGGNARRGSQASCQATVSGAGRAGSEQTSPARGCGSR